MNLLFAPLLSALRMLLAGMLCWIAPVSAAEVDQFTLPPDQPASLTDSAPVLAAEINRRMQQAVQQANAPYVRQHAKSSPRWWQPGCDETRLYNALTDALAGSVIGHVETFAEESPAIQRRRVPLADSIYRDFFWQASPTLVFSERMAAVIRVQDVEIGTDKLGHFFAEGYSYFVSTDQLRKSIESGLLFGEWSESVYFGAQTTGVFSFADLTANFQGLRFWNRVLARHPDLLTGRTPTPYVQCRKQQWVLARAFSWDDYIDNGWNEAINCVVLGNEDLLQRIQTQGLRCLIDQLPTEKYGQWQPRLLNLYGHRVLPLYLQPEVILAQRVALKDVDVSVETLDYIAELRARLDDWRRASAAALREIGSVP